jgi:hypothetical protein
MPVLTLNDDGDDDEHFEEKLEAWVNWTGETGRDNHQG